MLIDVPGGADPDGLHVATAVPDLPYRVDDRAQDQFRVGRGGDVGGGDDLAPGVDDAGGDLGAAQIDADRQAVR